MRRRHQRPLAPDSTARAGAVAPRLHGMVSNEHLRALGPAALPVGCRFDNGPRLIGLANFPAAAGAR